MRGSLKAETESGPGARLFQVFYRLLHGDERLVSAGDPEIRFSGGRFGKVHGILLIGPRNGHGMLVNPLGRGQWISLTVRVDKDLEIRLHGMGRHG